jgi:phosphonate transport system substrate-binding protein
LIAYAKSEEGKQTLHDLLDIDDFIRADDADYDIVRTTLNTIGAEASEFLK